MKVLNCRHFIICLDRLLCYFHSCSTFPIQVECARIFLQHTNGGFDNVRKSLLELPLRVPGSTLGVRLRLDWKNSGEPRLLGKLTIVMYLHCALDSPRDVIECIPEFRKAEKQRE